jgi:hypothetical protein
MYAAQRLPSFILKRLLLMNEMRDQGVPSSSQNINHNMTKAAVPRHYLAHLIRPDPLKVSHRQMTSHLNSIIPPPRRPCNSLSSWKTNPSGILNGMFCTFLSSRKILTIVYTKCSLHYSA